jgi:hypothetical protein
MEALMNKVRTTVLALTAMLAAGCNEGTMAPRSQSSQAPEVGGGFSASLTGWDTARFVFTIDPARTLTYALGSGNSITFPAGSLCDPSSTYGMTEWDKPCAPATGPINIATKAWLDRNGNPQVDFGTHVRFVPTAVPSGWVTITFGSKFQAASPFFNILYCTSIGQQCINESLTDPSLATVVDPITNRVWRRIKHFSGYILTSGDGCDPTVQDCSDQTGGSSSLSSMSHLSASTLTRVEPLLRGHTLPDHPSKGGDIGPLGGELHLPQAGVTLIVPPGAVLKTMHFSITSVQGRIVAYDFEPHGAQFAVPLLLVQDLRGTNHRAGQSLIGGYFADDSQLDSNALTASVNELLAVTLDEAAGQVVLPIHHFSGYMLASGNQD